MDVQNFGFSSFGGNEKGTVTATITFGGNSIPENSYKNIVVNTPMLARTAYSVGKYMLDEGMRAKMSINGSDQEKKLKEVIDEEWIPDVYGGKSPF